MKKPIVHYTQATVHGERCWLKPVDHPNHLPGHDVSNEYPVTTSSLVSCDHETGRIETKNTIYMPLDELSELNGKRPLASAAAVSQR